MERAASSVALEQRYVHDVYDNIAPFLRNKKYKAWPRVRRFLEELPTGSMVADIGCGNGRYLSINDNIFKLGSDHCAKFIEKTADNGREVMVCDNLHLPYRDAVFDAVVSVGVIHHFATIERRVAALREIARIVQDGGKVMVYVWAMEQHRRKFEAQDVLVPWNKEEKEAKSKRKAVLDRHASNSSISEDESLSESIPIHLATARVDDKKDSTRMSLRNLFEKIADLVEKVNSLDEEEITLAITNGESENNKTNDLKSKQRTDSSGDSNSPSPSHHKSKIKKKRGIKPSLSSVRADSYTDNDSLNIEDDLPSSDSKSTLPEFFKMNILNFLSNTFSKDSKDDISSEEIKEVDKDALYKRLVDHISNHESHIFDSREWDVPEFQVREFPMSSQPRQNVSKNRAFQSSNKISPECSDCCTNLKPHHNGINTLRNLSDNFTPTDEISSISLSDDEVIDNDTLFNDTLLQCMYSDDSVSPCIIQNSPGSNGSAPTPDRLRSPEENPELTSMYRLSSNQGHIINATRPTSLQLKSKNGSHIAQSKAVDANGGGVIQNGVTNNKEPENLEECVQNIADDNSAANDLNHVLESILSPTYQRYYHVFKDGELLNLIKEHVPCLRVCESFYDHGNWCVILEKVDL